MRRILCFTQMVDFISDLLLEVVFMLVQLQAFVHCTLILCACMFDSALVFYSQLNFFQLSYPWWLTQSGATSFRYHLRALCCKCGHLLTGYSLHFSIDAVKVGTPFGCIWRFVIFLFMSLFGQTAGVRRIRAHGEDLSSSARLSSAAEDRVLFHSLQWKRVHRDLRGSIVCALRCLITFDWTPY